MNDRVFIDSNVLIYAYSEEVVARAHKLIPKKSALNNKFNKHPGKVLFS